MAFRTLTEWIQSSPKPGRRKSARTTKLRLEWLEERCTPSAGDLDPGFGTNGIVTTNFSSTSTPNGNDIAHAVAVQPDGKIVVVGQTNVNGSLDFAMDRYLTNGQLDPSFGNGGEVITDFTGSQDIAYGVAIQADGKIVVVGQAYAGSTFFDFGVVRYLSNGQLDTSFGTGGKVTTDFSGIDEAATAVTIQSDGMILVAGRAGSGHFGLVRYTSTGQLDTSFGTGGKVTTDINQNSTDQANAIALQPDGKIVLAGYSGSHYALARYTSSGQLDTTFGTGGILTADLAPSTNNVAQGVVVLSSGRIVAAGYSNGQTGFDFSLMAFTPTGQLDTTFGTGGKVDTDMSGSSIDEAQSILAQADGKLVVSGFAFKNGSYQFAVATYLSDGQLDPNFGTGGKVLTPIGTADAMVGGAAFQSDGKIVVAGVASMSTTGKDFTVARYISDAPPVAIAGGPYTVQEGSSIILDGSSSSDPYTPTSALTYAWDLNSNGIYGETGAAATNGNEVGMNPTFVTGQLDGPTTVTIHLRVTNAEGLTSTNSTTIQIQAAPPTVDAGSNQTVHEGDTVNLSGTFTDPGAADTFSQSWTVTDASGHVVASGSGAMLSFVPSDDGTYTGAYTVSDTDGGGTSTGTVTITALPVAPTVNAGTNQTVNEGDLVFLSGTFTDPSSTDAFSQTWVVTDGSGQRVASGPGASLSFTPTDDGTYTATYSVTDTDGGFTGTGTVTITARSVAPIVNAGSNQTVHEGDTVKLSGSFADPSSTDTFNQSWIVTDAGGQVVASGPGATLTFVPSDDGVYTGFYTVTDTDNGMTGTGTVTITALSVPPTVNPGPSQTVHEGDKVTVSGTFTDPNPAESFNQSWVVTDANGQVVASGAGATLTFVAGDDGTYTATYSVTDVDGGDTGTGTVAITVLPVPPTAFAGSNQTVNEGDTVTLTGSFVDHGVGDTFNQSWTVTNANGQVVAGGTGATIKFVPGDDGVYTGTYSVTDSDGGGTGTSTVTITALPVPPIVNAGPDQTVHEGDTVRLSGTFTDPGVGDSFSQNWTVTNASGQVVAGGSGSSITFVPSDDGIYTGTFSVTDSDGGFTGTGTVTITSLAVAPTVNAGANQTVNEGDTVSLSGTFSDLGLGDNFAESWTVKNGAGHVVASGSGATIRFVPNDDGTYAGTFSVTDTDGGGTGTGTVIITALNVAPTVNPGNNQTVNLGSSVTVSGTFTDPSTVDTFTQSWVVTNGAGQTVASGNGASLTFTPSAVGHYTATYTVADDDGGMSSAAVIITVVNNNTAPVASISGPTAGVREEPLNFVIQAQGTSGSSASSTFTYSINWGDGSAPQTVSGPGSGVSLAHSFAQTGAFTIRVTATNSAGLVSPVATLSVQISSVLLQSDPLAPGKTMLLVGGTPGDDHIKVEAQGCQGEFEIEINHQHIGRFRPTSRIVVYGGAGNDFLEADGRYNIQVWLIAGPGKNFLKGGNGPTLLLGGPGNDVVIGGGGRNILVGGGGRDILIAGGGGDVLIPDKLSATDQQLYTALKEWASTDSKSVRIRKLTQWGVFKYLTGDDEPDRVIGNRHKNWIVRA
jgi:uncharacterized delta-60 repeat protein